MRTCDKIAISVKKKKAMIDIAHTQTRCAIITTKFAFVSRVTCCSRFVSNVYILNVKSRGSLVAVGCPVNVTSRLERKLFALFSSSPCTPRNDHFCRLITARIQLLITHTLVARVITIRRGCRKKKSSIVLGIVARCREKRFWTRAKKKRGRADDVYNEKRKR